MFEDYKLFHKGKIFQKITYFLPNKIKFSTNSKAGIWHFQGHN